MIFQKKTPPFGKKILKNRHSCSGVNEIFIFLGADCWDWGKKDLLRPVLVLPDIVKPDDFNWQSIVRNKKILLWLTGNTTHEQLRKFAYLLLKSGSVIVRAIDMQSWKMIAIYQKESGGSKYEC